MKVSISDMKARLDLHEVARRLGISEWPGKTGSCRSPLRPDKSESFSIFEKDGELFWKDHATGDGGDSILLIQHVRQCDPKAAIQWMADQVGVKQEASKSSSMKSSWENRELVSIYDYKNAEGLIVHQTLRYRDKVTGAKSFLQRRPAREGERFGKYEAKLDRQRGGWWIWSLAGIEPVLYRIPEMMEREAEKIWIFEGEKDADNAARLGLVTTTSPMGAGKWRSSFSTALKGRNVVICPDRDEPGMNHAVLVTKELQSVGCQVEVVDWSLLWPTAPEGKLDFTDWSTVVASSVNQKEAA